jgi:hypothetical protein
LLRSGVAEKTNETESTKHGQKRNPIARAHGFRKLVTTNMVRAKVNPEAREMLLGHSIGLNKAYYRPCEDELLEEYLKAVDMLTINEENRLRKQVEYLKIEKSEIEKLRDEVEGFRRLKPEMDGLINEFAKLKATINQAIFNEEAKLS